MVGVREGEIIDRVSELNDNETDQALEAMNVPWI